MTQTIPTHPGETLRHCLADSELTASELAAELAMSRSTLYRLMRGELPVTAAVAVALERLGWSNAEFWLRMQNQFDLAQVRKAPRAA